MIIKDKEVMERLSEIEKKLTDTFNKMVVINDKLDILLDLWEIPTPTDKDEEVWRTIYRYGEPTICEISNLGRERLKDTGEILPTHYNASGKPRANVYWMESGIKRASTALVENLVARAFIDTELSHRSQSVRHIDGDVSNCKLDNLYIKRKGNR